MANFNGSPCPLIESAFTFVGSLCIAFLFAVLLAREQMFDEEEIRGCEAEGKTDVRYNYLLGDCLFS